ncbi:molybdopterin converting factor subunit 1 [Thioclava sp. SK-1]|uniref:molybdopterin converting factor subunit 1 n=1 Tax=Thioclava sp. SK-1 TaxID=1889770 RepID=UPI0008255F9A|nr:molybdopterin converting factor subunit 1 [Thioclava sp. SK-1]OCX66584.1 molybdopterin converting factor subunit 1 [Thioclava sp. SK-1]
MELVYFAWVRERIGRARESIETQAATPLQLIEELSARDERYGAALSDVSALRVAIDQELADFDTKLTGAREVAFFPPMTGG